MFRNYLVTAIRNIKRHKAFSTINILGLAVGMAVCIMIMIYVQSELSYDKFHKDYDRIYRVEMTKIINGENDISITFKHNFGERILQNISGIEMFTRIEALSFYDKAALSYKNNMFYEKGHMSVEPSFFKMFGFKAVSGNLNTAMDDPNSLVITEKLARKYFGRENPIGKTISFETAKGKESRIITAVLEDVPGNTHIQFNMLTPLIVTKGNEGNSNYHTYFKIKDNIAADTIAKRISILITSDNPKYKNSVFSLKNITDIHLNSASWKEIAASGNITGLYIFAALAVLVLLLACINFMNLTTSGSIKRTMEIGLRKVLGADKKALIKQFIGEAFLLSAISFLISLTIVLITLPWYKEFTGIDMSFGIFFTFTSRVLLLFLLIITSITAGAYPAFILSNYDPVNVFNKNIPVKKKGIKINLRKSLIIFQFVITSALFVGVIIIVKQMNFVLNKDLGYSKEQILVLELNSNNEEQAELLKSELKKISSIKDLTLTSFLPDKIARQSGFVAETEQGMSEMIMANSGKIDPDFIKTYGIQIIQGANILPAGNQESNAFTDQYLLNETAVKTFGLKSPVGKRFGLGKVYKGIIAGIVKDFHFSNLHETIAPLVLHYQSNPAIYISIKLNTNDIINALAEIKNTFKDIYIEKPFEYYFFDDVYNKMYRADIKFLDIIKIFSGISGFIACIGLLGQVLLSAEIRKKEIGIRKVLGAEIKNVIAMLSKEYIYLIIIANIIAIPVSYYLMRLWLNDFAYKTDISWWIFLLAMAVSLVIAMLTISWQTYKAATANPVESIRYE